MWQNIPMSTPVNFMPKTSNLEPTLIPGSLSLICLHSRCGDGVREAAGIKVNVCVCTRNNELISGTDLFKCLYCKLIFGT